MTDPVSRARELFLDDSNYYGCAETTYVALQELFSLSDADDSAPAMPLNGGVAYSGGACGAITGAALAVGRLAARHLPDHFEAKRESRRLIQDLMADFIREFGSASCRDLIPYDLLAPGQHDAFIASGIWRDVCMRQIEFAVERVARLAAEAGWASSPGDDPAASPPAPNRQPE